MEEFKKQMLGSAELKVEQDAATDFFERTGKSMYTLGSVEQRKIFEAWKEDHEPTS